MSVRVMARVWAESKHSGSELLMLLAIADFADDGARAFPAVSTLATKCRMSLRNAQYVLGSLQQSGELEVLRSRGPAGANVYQIKLQGMQASAPALQPAAPPPPATDCTPRLQPAAGEGCNGLRAPLQPAAPNPSLTTTEPPLNHHTEKRTGKPRDVRVEFADLLEGVEAQHLQDWLANRKARRLPLTRTALEGLKREATKAGMTVAQAVAVCAEKGWSGFKAEWVPEHRVSGGATRPMSPSQQVREERVRTMQALTGRRDYRAGINEGGVIEGDELVREVRT